MTQPRSFTLDDLRDVMRACVRMDEAVNLDTDIGDMTFADLGYDSLAMLEMAAKLQNDLRVAIPGDVVTETLTPNSVIDYVNMARAR
jgi:act minimal PKS acyl carrier protein